MMGFNFDLKLFTTYLAFTVTCYTIMNLVLSAVLRINIEYLNSDCFCILFISVMIHTYIDSNKNNRASRDINCFVLTTLAEYSISAAPAA